MYCTVLLYTLEAAGAGEARSVQKEKCTVQVYTGSGQAGQSVRRPPLPLSVQLQALQSSLREDSKQIVMGYQSANWCLEWKAKWLLASDLAKCQDILLEPPSASSEPSLISSPLVSWLKEAKKKYQGTQSVCAVLSEVHWACIMRQPMVTQNCERKLSTMCNNLLFASILFTRKWPSPTT